MAELRREERIAQNIDWLTVLLFALMVAAGWLNIFAAVYDAQSQQSIFDLDINSGKQILWIGTTIIIITMLMAIDYKFFDSFAYVIYGAMMIILIGVLFGGKVVAGSKSWIGVGGFGIQPSEFSKTACALALAKFLSKPGLRLDRTNDMFTAAAIIALPALLILLQNDTGSTLVFSSFIIVLYREGLPPVYPVLGITVVALFILTLLVPQLYLIIGLVVLALIIIALIPKSIKNIAVIAGGLAIVVAVVMGVDFFVNDVLQPHQQNRIKALIDPDGDPLGYGWNVTQSKIAIGSGGFLGKGFLEGTQTKFDFVPEQSTDFIFCTIGEEHGWFGSFLVIAGFMTLLMRIVFLAERQKSRFARVYGYSVASILFFHMMVNIGMTIGLFPVIGIPLPFFSYGGSSLWSFTILLFILLKLDAHRSQILNRY